MNFDWLLAAYDWKAGLVLIALVVAASLVGAALLMAADILARGLIAPQELPVGVLTAVLGGSYLLWLMHRGSTNVGGRQ